MLYVYIVLQSSGNVLNIELNRIALSSIIRRHDIDITSKILEVNKSLKALCTKHGYAFIDNQNIDKSCLNGSNLHLNAKG